MVTTTRRTKPGSSASAPGTPTGSQQPQQPQKPPQQAPQQQGTGFVDFSRVVAANRAGAQQMANRTAQQVRQAGQNAQQAIQGGQNTFTAATQAATLAYDPSRAPDQATAAQLAQTRYEGPKTWEDAGVDVGRATRLASNAQDQARALGTDGGRAALLRMNSANALTGGGSALDAALMGNALGAEAYAIGDEFGSLSQMLADARGGAGAAYDAANAATRDAAAQYGTLATNYQTQADAAARAERMATARRLAEERAARQRGRELQDGFWTQDEADRYWDRKDPNRRGREI